MSASAITDLLGGRAANAGMLPPGPGPAPTGRPFPSAPQASPGSHILWQHLDPRTTLLSNIPSAPGQAAAESPPSTTSTTLPLTAGTTDSMQAYIRGRNQAEPWDVSDPGTAFRHLSHLMRVNDRDAKRLGMDPGSTADPESLSLLQSLIDAGHITVSPTDFDNTTGVPFPGGEKGRQRIVELVDFWRDMQNASVPGYQPQYQEGQ